MTKAKGWKRAESTAKRYLLAVTHFLHELSDDQMVRVTAQSHWPIYLSLRTSLCHCQQHCRPQQRFLCNLVYCICYRIFSLLAIYTTSLSLGLASAACCLLCANIQLFNWLGWIRFVDLCLAGLDPICAAPPRKDHRLLCSVPRREQEDAQGNSIV